VGLAIPTLNAGDRWADCLGSIAMQSLKANRLLDIDSDSNDQTAELAKRGGFEILKINRSDFNHGGTRQLAVYHLADCDVVVFLTQDAILASAHSLRAIVECFSDPNVAVAYGRQLPHKWATAIETHARVFSYGTGSVRKDAVLSAEIGSKVFFCSNSFAAYRTSVMSQLGGFSSELILGEDMEYAARAILAGYSNVYCSEAPVYHSHDYTIAQTFQRYFDIGVFDAMNSWMRTQFGSHSGEGLRFVASEMKYLAIHAPLQLPKSIAHNAAKFVAYRLGRLQRLLPIRIKRRLTMQPGFWR
jgi:rhamnosyltransferase